MSMQGWRIEVRGEVECYHGRSWSPDMTDPNGPTLTVYAVVIAPLIVKANFYGSRALLFAAVWPLRDTIYVSRALTDAESDALRELLDAELRRERAKAVIGDLADALDRGRRPPKSFTISPGFDCVEAGQAVTLAPDGTVRPVVTWTAPTVRATEAERAQVKAALEQLSSEWCARLAPADPYAALLQSLRADRDAQREAKAAPRVPQVGDEIEVLSNSWHRAEVTAVGGCETFRADWVNADGDPCALWVSFARTDRWRWPETQPLTGRPTPSAGDEIEVWDAAHGMQGAWLRYKVAQIASGPELRGFTGLPPSDFIALDAGEGIHGQPLLFAMPVDSDGWRWPS